MIKSETDLFEQYLSEFFSIEEIECSSREVSFQTVKF
jgi:hypothetical protein